MLAFVKQVGLGVVCATCGFVGGSLTRPATPVAPRPCPAASPPRPPPVALSPPPRVPVSPPLPAPPPPAARAAPPSALPPLEKAAVTRRETPLSAFRFLGIGPFGGLRLGRVRPGTLPAALGLRTGDELLTINDFRMSDPEQALTAYARLRYADRLSLVVARDGQQTAIVYFVR